MSGEGTAPEAKIALPVGQVDLSGGPLSRWLGRWGVAFGVAFPIAFWVGLVLFSPPGHGPPPEPLFASLLASTWLGPLAAFAAGRVGRYRGRGSVVEVTAESLVLRSEDGVVQNFPRSRIAAGLELPGKVALELVNGQRLELAVADGTGARLLDALELGATSRRAVYRWRRTFDALVAAAGGLGILSAFFLLVPSPALGALVCPLLAGLPWVFTAWMGRIFSERSIEIGADGVRARSRAGVVLARFADLERVEQVETPIGGRLVLVMKDGRREQVMLDPEDAALKRSVLARIEEARKAAASRPDGQRLAELLARAGSSFTELRKTAAGLLDASLGFRDATVTESEVAALLDDPVATAEQRIAAAIALAARKESGKTRVRVAAESCASPKLRVALDAAAEGTLDDTMLAEAEEEAGSERRARATAPT